MVGLSVSSKGQSFKEFGFKADWAVRTLYVDTLNGFLWAGGDFTKVNGNQSRNVAYYDGNSWKTLDYYWHGSFVSSVVQFKGDVYIAGNGGIRKWDGVKIDSVARGANGAVSDLYNFKDSLLMVAGAFSKVDDSIPALGIATWDGSKWDTLPVNVPRVGSFNDFSSIAYYKGEFYFAGNFTRFDANYGEDIIRFDGKDWKDVGGGLKGDSWVNDMAVFKDELYVIGEFFKSSGNADDHIMRWDGQQWKAVGGGTNFQAHRITSTNEQIVVAGPFDRAGSIGVWDNAFWDGNKWCSFEHPMSRELTSVAFYDGHFVFAGINESSTRDTIDRVFKLDTAGATPTCGAPEKVSDQDNIKKSLKVYPNPFTENISVAVSSDVHAFNISVYNARGRLMKFFDVVGNSTKVYMEDLPNGLYMLRVEYDNEMEIRKIIKQ